MNEPLSDGVGNAKRNTTPGPQGHVGTGRQNRRSVALVTPSPEVIAATEFLLSQPDAHLYRRRYLEILNRANGDNGTATTDYTAAERYLLSAARKLRGLSKETVSEQPRRQSVHHTPSDASPILAPQSTSENGAQQCRRGNERDLQSG